MTQISLLTFNAFGILNWDTPFRLRALVHKLNELAPDIVCLQEIHQHYFRRMIVSGALRYSAAIYEPMLYRPKGGLLTLAKAPFTTTRFHLYQEQGRWASLNIMDRMLRKGMLFTHHEYAGLRMVVVNTHLIANYAANYIKGSPAAALQARQLRQLADVVQNLPRDVLILVMGDFNIPRHSWLYDEFLERSGMEDTLSGDQRPTYRPLPGVPARYALPIDFVFVRRPSAPALAIHSDLTLDKRLPLVGSYVNYLSDHLGILTTVAWTDAAPPAAEDASPTAPADATTDATSHS
ncbi:MAG: hypothetical protein DCC57_03690 [Chloroflexi bacterium]|nr:MAG: hypothetical protein DCC57_03690 [Chloroflexota bacterium]